MQKVKAAGAYYEICEKLGEGLTSQVYRALRTDSGGWSQQTVALKIINSRNDVQILKTEFESLVQIQSAFCCRILAWENLKQGPSLVLEYVHGVTLRQLTQSQALSLEEIKDLLWQAHRGIKDLAAAGVAHGDINPNNIMVDESGQVKLIDFGFMDPSKDQALLTPQFASPARLKAGLPSEASDLFSLHAVAGWLLGHQKLEKSQPRLQLFLSSLARGELSHPPRLRQKRSLGQKVRRAKSQMELKTQPIEKSEETKPHSIVGPVVLYPLLSLLIVFSFPQSESPLIPATLSYRSPSWVKVSLNHLPGVYAPIFQQKLRPGRYFVRSENSKGVHSQVITLKPGQSFLLHAD